MTIDKWDERQLCSDGACVGVIGPDGTCKVCGRAAPNWGDERTRGLNPVEGDQDEADDDDEYEEEEEAEAAGDDEAYEDDEDDEDHGEPAATSVSATSVAGDRDWDDRELCSNGACVGVIGDDNKCKVCGKPGSAVARVIAPAAVITTDAVVSAEAVDTDMVKTDPEAPAE